MGADVEVKNVKRLNKKLNKMATAMTDDNLRNAVLAGLLIISNDAKVRAPVLTGHLARSITQEAIASGTTAAGRVGTNVEYATAQEFGTSRFPAQPYLRPAVDSKKKEALREVAEALRIIVRASAS